MASSSSNKPRPFRTSVIAHTRRADLGGRFLRQRVIRCSRSALVAGTAHGSERQFGAVSPSTAYVSQGAPSAGHTRLDDRRNLAVCAVADRATSLQIGCVSSLRLPDRSRRRRANSSKVSQR